VAKDRFHAYLDYCENFEPVSPGDYLEQVVGTTETLAWTRLMIDLKDTFDAGRLRKVKTTNGGTAYVRGTVQAVAA
jgi:hypothetical protein